MRDGSCSCTATIRSHVPYSAAPHSTLRSPRRRPAEVETHRSTDSGTRPCEPVQSIPLPNVAHADVASLKRSPSGTLTRFHTCIPHDAPGRTTRGRIVMPLASIPVVIEGKLNPRLAEPRRAVNAGAHPLTKWPASTYLHPRFAISSSAYGPRSRRRCAGSAHLVREVNHPLARLTQ